MIQKVAGCQKYVHVKYVGKFIRAFFAAIFFLGQCERVDLLQAPSPPPPPPQLYIFKIVLVKKFKSGEILKERGA